MSKIIDVDNTPCYSTYCGDDYFACGFFDKRYPITNPIWSHVPGIRRYDVNWEFMKYPDTKLSAIKDPWNRPIVPSFSSEYPVCFWRAEEQDTSWTDYSIRLRQKIGRTKVQLFRGITTVEGYAVRLALVHVPYEKHWDFSSEMRDDKDTYVIQL